MDTPKKKATQQKRKAAEAAEKQKIDLGVLLSFLKLDVEVRNRCKNKIKVVAYVVVLTEFLEEINGLLL
jgi:hypothetical protein